MLENDFYSIIKFILDNANDPAVYYHNVPENFYVPSIYFPTPEVDFKPDTLNSGSSEYRMYVMFFHSSTEDAYRLALPVYHAFCKAKRIIPEIDKSGRKVRYMHIRDIQLYKADECAYQMRIDWVSRYSYTREDAELARNFFLNGGKRL